jgi:thioredoxin 1
MIRNLFSGTLILLLAMSCAKAAEDPATPSPKGALPRVLDLGSTSCLPCQLMAPILKALRKEFEGVLQVEFVEVGMGGDPALAKRMGVKEIPTQVFFGPDGKELWRHEGYISRFGILDKWRELGHEFAAKALAPAFQRMEPAEKDERPKDRVCAICDGDIDLGTMVVVKTPKGDVRICGPHHFFVMESCLTGDKTGLDERVSVSDFATGEPVPAARAVFLLGFDETKGRPWIRAFAEREAALKERQTSGGSLLGWSVLKGRELAPRCGFCDRAVYPEDSALVKADGVHTWGCCSHCALGVAARSGRDIEVYQPDRLTGQMIVVKTLGGYISSLEPPTAVAWFGLRKNAEGKFGSAGCFHQGFFATAENLKAWVGKTPLAVGRMITIDEALRDKMKMSPQQIQKACKIGECAPK